MNRNVQSAQRPCPSAACPTDQTITPPLDACPDSLSASLTAHQTEGHTARGNSGQTNHRLCREVSWLHGRLPLVLGLLVGLWGSLAGCQKQSTSPSANDEEARRASAREALERKRLCSDNFLKITQVLQPEPENVDAELQSVQDLLNQWFYSCAEWQGAELPTGQPEWENLSDSLFSKFQLAQQTASLFDVLYLRDQLLMRAILENQLQDVPDDATKIRRLFSYVCRNIAFDEKLISPQLMPPEQRAALNAGSIPRGLQDICLIGRGTAADRAWVFASLMQQLGQPLLLLEAPATEPPTPERWRLLLLVPVEESLLVFHPGSGLELRPTEGNWPTTEAAGIWEKLDEALPTDLPEAETLLAPLRQQEWSQARWLLPYSVMSISPRMRAIQLELTGDMACEVYVPLRSESEQSGLQEQLQGSLPAAWSEFQPQYWEYPQQMYVGVVERNRESETLRRLALATLMKEVVSVRSSEDQEERRVLKSTLEKRLLMGRLDQLIGDHADAISTYMKIRLQQGVEGEGAEIALENLMRFLQAENAHYWSALAQYERGEFRSASDTLKNYLNRYDQGNWTEPGRELLIRSYVAMGKPEPALELLKKHPPSGPDQLWKKLLLHELQPSE